MIIFGVKIKLLMLKIVDRKKCLKIVYYYVLFEILFNFKLVIFWNYIKMDFIYKLKKSRVKFDDVNFLFLLVEIVIIISRR